MSENRLQLPKQVQTVKVPVENPGAAIVCESLDISVLGAAEGVGPYLEEDTTSTKQPEPKHSPREAASSLYFSIVESHKWPITHKNVIWVKNQKSHPISLVVSCRNHISEVQESAKKAGLQGSTAGGGINLETAFKYLLSKSRPPVKILQGNNEKKFKLGPGSGGAYVKAYYPGNLEYTLGGEVVMGGDRLVIEADDEWMLDKDYKYLVKSA